MGDLLETCELAFCNELEITRPNLAMDIVHRHPTISQLIIKRLNHCEYLMDRSVDADAEGYSLCRFSIPFSYRNIYRNTLSDDPSLFDLFSLHEMQIY